MNETMKSAKFDFDTGDSDSHNYTHNESESYSAEDAKYDVGKEESSDPFEKLRSSAADTLHQRTGWIFLVGVLLSVLAVCCWNLQVDVKDRSESISSIRVKDILLACSLGVFTFIGLNFVIFKTSFLGMKRSSSLNTFFYYANELSEHSSAGIIFILGFSLALLKGFDYCVYNRQGLDLFLSDVFSSLLIATLMLGVVKVFHRAISMNFNYSVYIKRIRRVLLEDAFINLLGVIDSRKNRGIERSRLNRSQEIMYKSDAISSINEYMEDLYGYNEPTNELDLPRKRVLLKEFQRLVRRSSGIRGSVIQISQKLKNRAASKASKIVGKDGVGPMSDLSLYFHNPEVFKFLMKEIGVEEGFKFTKGSLADFIERTYRERHFLKENLEHMNSAIDKVALGLKVIIAGLILAMLYIKAGGEGITTIGVISAFFGTQFISNSFSASVIGSIIFLFFIHPYDIGDRIFVTLDGVEENLVVSELNVFSTVFYRWDGVYITILNTVLAQKAIRNLRRSGIMAESHRIQINSRTNQKKLIRLKELIEDFVKSNPEDYTEYIMLNHEYIEDASKLHMKVYMQYKSSWQNFELYLRRKTKFLSFLNRALQELEIEYVLPPRQISLRNA
ncbi:hypothetical protein EHEL_011070 [Encephalitozoon hellem ATCC 50504]|uniref:Mechanosensitive ion channel protein n=1 Tax=Encephalitozoon hellem TaxID=27973 RepID=A0A9Q9C8J8_ENCHE|nr:uncharacterized protein EHEL_011070 [Encephalitozoon hellem ATCC 50504]AFM97730.1 hypothetical protein EHEL_011070 [Encephalitozoon hellem ATCC 50504]UTX42422.1 mechanosensitive ion channel protein [Encephalitozoon hellem]WEL37865.1 mechanosensitive ion channel protein [Encephalitozoon hellem]|eukprot:XP_003886711.1 hypothetical protein EHEL_011070 [Encephalitozoon hellem ATCC 50504]